MKKRIFFWLLLTMTGIHPVIGQELEYKMELGGALGGSFYLGDLNNTPFKNLGASGGVLARYILNPRMAIKGNLFMGHISGDNRDVFIPENGYNPSTGGGTAATVNFSRNVFDLGAQFEFNFWGYGMGNSYKDNSRITPYMLVGAGLTFAPKPANIVVGFNIPIGVGVKYKLKERINIGFEWSVRFTTSDALDTTNPQGAQVIHPYGIEAKGFKNKDCYSLSLFYITYDLFPKYRLCNN